MRAAARPALHLLTSALALGCAAARANDAVAAPSMVDTVERGLRLRVDGWGRTNTVLAPAPPVRLTVEETEGDSADLDVSGLVLFGWDRPMGLPLAFDVMGTATGDLLGDSPTSAFLDDTSAAARAQLYSAFVAISGAPGEALEPFTLQLGRMTEMAASPVTYDGVAAGARFALPGRSEVRARLWGGLDAPQRLAADPFSRIDPRASSERLVEDTGFASSTRALTVERRPLDVDGDGSSDPVLNAVGGLRIDARVVGVDLSASHSWMPTVQRSSVAASSTWDLDVVLLHVGGELAASELVPRQASARADVQTADGNTRLWTRVALQFLPDVCAYDCTFRAAEPAALIVRGDVAALEGFRVRDQIRHLNFSPPREHVAGVLDLEQQLPSGFLAGVHGRLRQHFNDADLDYFRSNVLEGGADLSWTNARVRAPLGAGPVLDAGLHVTVGSFDTGAGKPYGFDLRAEGLAHNVETRVHLRTTVLEGRLSNLTELFVRRQDVEARAYLARGQWSGALASALRYDVSDAWSVSARVDADALSPLDAFDGSGYFAVLLGTSLHL